MKLGYNTNGFAHHRLEDAAEILAELGYKSLAVTLECDLLDPPDRTASARAVHRLANISARLSLTLTIETGSRYILDPWRKHYPTLISPDENDRGHRIEFLKSAVDIAAATKADSVSLWSGKQEAANDETTFDLLNESLQEILTHAEESKVRLAFEPEPGMFIDTMDKFARLHERLNHPLFGLTLDVGHVHCLADGDTAAHIERWREVLWNIHIEDMQRGIHNHLMFGDGDMDFAPIFTALKTIEYSGPIHVELSRHSHDAVEAARQSKSFLTPFLE